MLIFFDCKNGHFWPLLAAFGLFWPLLARNVTKLCVIMVLS
nr:MAG TPA: hypothetical protein [Caudoviricetes sp.]